MSFYLLATFISGFMFFISYIGGAQLVEGIHNRVGTFFLVLFTIVTLSSGIVFVKFLSEFTASIVVEIIIYAIDLVF